MLLQAQPALLTRPLKSPWRCTTITRGAYHIACRKDARAMAPLILASRCDLCKDNPLPLDPPPQHGGRLLIDLTGQRFGRLIVQHLFKRKGGMAQWCCLCDCHTGTLVWGKKLRSGLTRSCQCFRRDAGRINSTTHGFSHLREHRIWYHMLARCTNPQHTHYQYYGGRGITICARWLLCFENFFADMGTAPSSLHTIERKDNNGHYSPENCVWATRQEQMNNRRVNVVLSLQEHTMTLKQWSVYLGITYETLRGRLSRGWSVERTLLTPVMHRA